MARAPSSVFVLFSSKKKKINQDTLYMYIKTACQYDHCLIEYWYESI